MCRDFSFFMTRTHFHAIRWKNYAFLADAMCYTFSKSKFSEKYRKLMGKLDRHQPPSMLLGYKVEGRRLLYILRNRVDISQPPSHPISPIWRLRDCTQWRSQEGAGGIPQTAVTVLPSKQIHLNFFYSAARLLFSISSFSTKWRPYLYIWSRSLCKNSPTRTTSTCT